MDPPMKTDSVAFLSPMVSRKIGSLCVPIWRTCPIPDQGATHTCQNPYPAEGSLRQFPPPPPPPTLGLNINDRRINSSKRNKTGTPLFLRNSRVSPGAHPLTKKPENPGYEIGLTIYSKVLAHASREQRIAN